MTRLDLIDPTIPDDPAFDPQGAQAQRVRRAALARPRSARPRARPPVRRLLFAGTAVTAAAVVALAVGTGSAPTDARAALARAAERTAAFESGRIVFTVRFGSGSGPRGHGRTEVRFDDGNIQAVVRDVVVAQGRTMEVRTTSVHFDGSYYGRDDTQPGARLKRLGKSSPVDPARLLVEQVGSPALVDLVRGAKDLSESGGGGQTTYRGTRTAGEVEDAAPTAAGRSQGGAWDRPVTLEVVVGDDGLIRRVRITDEVSERVIEYSELGEDQAIERPSP